MPRLFDKGEPARYHADIAVMMACRGEDAKAYLDSVEDEAKRKLAKAQARAAFQLIQFHARQAARMHPADTERYVAKRVPPGMQEPVSLYAQTLRRRAEAKA